MYDIESKNFWGFFVMRLMRSLLFVPGHREGWAAKALASGTDGVILDLEDSVPVDSKAEARNMVARSIAELRTASSTVGIYVRLNAFETGMTGEDIAKIVVPGLDGVLPAKTFGPKEVTWTEALLDHYEHRNGIANGGTEIIIPLETAQAYATCEAMIAASPRVKSLFAGTARDADVSRSIGFRFTEEGAETLYLRSRALLAVRAAGLDFPLVGLWQEPADLDGMRRFAEANRNLGFRGQVLIHPAHVAIANEVFSPSAQEFEFYSGMIAAFIEAEAQGIAAVTYEGHHIDYAHVKTAREVVALYNQLIGR
jgi:citrate lyase subunit beta/citryl-CoA lyase